MPRQAAGSPFVYVTGQVTLDAPDLREGMRRSGDTTGARGVVMHELGHVLGLGHVDDPDQLMHPEGTVANTFADGDRAGLARLGAGACAPRL